MKQKIILTLVFLIAGLGIFFYQSHIAKAATFYWDQLDWTGSPVADLFTHAPVNGTTSGWTKYSEVGPNNNIDLTGGNVSISISNLDKTHTSTSGEESFGASGGGITVEEGGTGDSGRLKLDLP